jgi:hypothetical protein
VLLSKLWKPAQLKHSLPPSSARIHRLFGAVYFLTWNFRLMVAIAPRLHVMRWAISNMVISVLVRSVKIRFTSCSVREQPCLAISTKPP